MNTLRVLVWCIILSGLALYQSGYTAQTPFPEVQLYIDNAPVDFVSQVVSNPTGAPAARMPAVLVHDRVMLPVRLFDEVLGDHLDLHLDPWGIVQIGNPGGTVYAFKTGERTAYTSAPMIGGDLPAPVELPAAPMLINGRLYVPAMPTLSLFGHSAQWEAKARALRITSKPGGTH